jgi:recombinational DNA repair protein (RecF pathway)
MTEPEHFERSPVEACADCGAPEAPYAYLQDGRHYCIRCARVKLVRDQIRPAGKRDDDLSLDDVLFTELPDSRAEPDAAGS